MKGKRKKKHWIDNADSYICPVCGKEVSSPAKYEGCKCPECKFQDEKDQKTMVQVIEEVCEQMCNDFCRFSYSAAGYVSDDGSCGHFDDCPLNKLQ